MTDCAFEITGLSVAAGVVAGAAMGAVGYVAGGRLSDLAGRVGSSVDSAQPKRGEAIGRTVMTAMTGLAFTQSPELVAFQVAATATRGAFTYVLD